MNERIRVVEYKGTKIVMQDFSRLDKESVVMLLNESHQFMSKYPKGSLLVATNLDGLHFDKEVIKCFEDVSERNKPYIRGSAMFGVGHLQKVAIESVGKMSQRHFTIVGTQDEAFEHLIHR